MIKQVKVIFKEGHQQEHCSNCERELAFAAESRGLQQWENIDVYGQDEEVLKFSYQGGWDGADNVNHVD